MNQDLERELRMLGIMIPAEDEIEVEEDLRALHLSKDWYLEAFTFNGHYDMDDLNQYFDQEGIDWDNRYSGAGGYFQDCSVTKKGTRTIAYIGGGYDI